MFSWLVDNLHFLVDTMGAIMHVELKPWRRTCMFNVKETSLSIYYYYQLWDGYMVVVLCFAQMRALVVEKKTKNNNRILIRWVYRDGGRVASVPRFKYRAWVSTHDSQLTLKVQLQNGHLNFFQGKKLGLRLEKSRRNPGWVDGASDRWPSG